MADDPIETWMQAEARRERRENRLTVLISLAVAVGIWWVLTG